jgi:CRP-like cAMP-binding protein
MKLTTAVPALSECTAEGDLALEIEQRSTRFTPGDHGLLFTEGDSPDAIYYLKEGEALLSMHDKGDSILFLRAVAGSILGLPAILGNGPYSLTANAIESAKVFKISAASFKEMIQQNPQLSIQVIRILAAEVRSARMAVIERSI